MLRDKMLAVMQEVNGEIAEGEELCGQRISGSYHRGKAV